MNSQNQMLDISDIKELVLRYLKKWRWYVLSTFICGVFALFYIVSSNPKFIVQSTVLIRNDDSKNKFSEMAMFNQLGYATVNKEVEDELHILQSKSLVSSVILDLDLATEYFVKSKLRYVDIYPSKPFDFKQIKTPNGAAYGFMELTIRKTDEGHLVDIEYIDLKGKKHELYLVRDITKPFVSIAGTLQLFPTPDYDKNNVYKIKSYAHQTIVDIYNKRINVSTINKKSSAVNISIIAENTVRAQALINKMIELYNLDQVIDKNIIANNTREFVEERLRLLREELIEVEESVEEYKKERGMTNTDQQADFFMRTTGEYNKELSKIETQLNLMQYIDEHVKNIENKYSLIPANLGVQDASLQQLIASYNSALLDRLRLNRTTNAQNPLVSQLEERINALRESIVTSLVTINDGLLISKRELMFKEKQFKGKIKEMPTQEREYTDIKRQQEIKNNLYVFLLQKREENALSLASNIPSAKTLDTANVVPNPVSPKKLFILAVALFIGFLIPTIIIYVIDFLDNTIKSKKDLLRSTKVPFLGTISIYKATNYVALGHGVSTPIAEMFRLIRTNFQFMLSSRKSHVVLVTSAGSGDGKSFVALNLALSFALTNKRVALVGLDIRKPKLAEYLNVINPNGISHFLASESVKISDIINKSVEHENLDVLVAGPTPPNPTELLMNYRLEELMDELRANYDYVILDSAPLALVSDTYLINRVADNTVFVCRERHTPREAVNLLNEIYEKGSLQGLGLILNAVADEHEYGYGYSNT